MTKVRPLKKTLSVVLSFILLISSVFSITASAYEFDNYDGALDIENLVLKQETVSFNGVTSTAVKICEQVEQHTSYAVSFSYKGEEADVGFFTAALGNVSQNVNCIEGENVAVAQLSAASSYSQAVAYFTVGTVAQEGQALYMYIIGSDNIRDAKDITIENLKSVGELNENGEYVVTSIIGQMGARILDTYEDPTVSQAIRCEFSYDTTDGTDIHINGQSFTVLERGFIFANGAKAIDQGVTVTTANADKSLYVLKSVKTAEELEKCWLYKQTKDSDKLSFHFSTYVTGFDAENNSYSTKQLFVRGFVKFTDGTNEFYLYSRPINESVKSIAAQLGATSD